MKQETAPFDDILMNRESGNAEHFSILYDHFRGLVFTVAMQVLNNYEDAEDVTQEVFLKASERGDLFDPDRGSVKTWLATMARNRAIDRFRTKKRQAQLKTDYEEEASVSVSGKRQAVSSRLESAERALSVRKAVSQLTPDQQKVIELTFFRGLTQREAAEELGAPLGTVKARSRRGLIRLRNLVPVDEI